jgi:hypothetical protein
MRSAAYSATAARVLDPPRLSTGWQDGQGTHARGYRTLSCRYAHGRVRIRATLDAVAQRRPVRALARSRYSQRAAAVVVAQVAARDSEALAQRHLAYAPRSEM